MDDLLPLPVTCGAAPEFSPGAGSRAAPARESAFEPLLEPAAAQRRTDGRT
ncbi:hypothetical protein [Streptomyces qinglanensis]|uniref:hypothetical protein n=1 Tax=Streptomyces qinglanensis TaxID=943816 RepID=UPI000A84CEB6|nr:hypothetical protein [Streptomyces qinglanensis]